LFSDIFIAFYLTSMSLLGVSDYLSSQNTTPAHLLQGSQAILFCGQCLVSAKQLPQMQGIM